MVDSREAQACHAWALCLSEQELWAREGVQADVRGMKRWICSIGIGVAGLLAGGCGDPLPPADITFLSGSEHNEMDPQRMSWAHDIRLARCLYEPLVSLDYSDMTLHPAVAERWEVSEDQRTYTFHLRDDARWSNGDPVTSHDFVYAWRRAMLPDLASDYTRLTWHIEGARAFFDLRQSQIEALASGSASADAETLYDEALVHFDETVGLATPNERTLVVTLERPTAFFEELVSFATFVPVHRASVEPTETLSATTGMLQRDPSYWSDPTRLVTNGPYVLMVRAFRQGLHLAKNPRYWDAGSVRNESLNERVITNPQTALQNYEAGRGELWLDVPSASSLAADLASQDRPDVRTQTMAGTYFYNFNCLPEIDGRANPLADARVRRALSMAIDRTQIVQRVTRLDQPIARSYIPEGVLRDYEPPVEKGVTLDVEQARALLSEAGYPNGQGLTGLSILYNNGHGHEYIAQAVKAMWEQNLGVIVTLEGVETKSFAERLKRQDYTIARASWFGDYPDPTTWLDRMHSRDHNNDTRWSNQRFDGLLAEAEKETDRARRLAILREAEGVLLEDSPMALIYQYVSIYLISPKVEGLEPNPWHRWRLRNARVVE